MQINAQHEGHTTPVVADTVKKSIPREVHAQLGGAHVMLHYHAPAVRGRVIWGGLVPYDEVWVTGAHRATTWEFDKAMIIGDKTVPAGKYAVFTIPGKDKWTVILNKNWDQHLADNYDAKDDVVRSRVAPQVGSMVERLTYEIKDDGNSKGRLIMAWEKVNISLSFQVVDK